MWTRLYIQTIPASQTRQNSPVCVVSVVAVWTESARPPDKCVQHRSVSGDACTVGATAGRTPTQNALVGWSDRLSSHRLVVSGGRCELGINEHTKTVRLFSLNKAIDHWRKKNLWSFLHYKTVFIACVTVKHSFSWSGHVTQLFYVCSYVCIFSSIH